MNSSTLPDDCNEGPSLIDAVKEPNVQNEAQPVKATQKYIVMEGLPTRPDTVTQSFVVEFWPKPADEIVEDEQPGTIHCGGAESAISIQTQLRSLGWQANALKLEIGKTFLVRD